LITPKEKITVDQETENRSAFIIKKLQHYSKLLYIIELFPLLVQYCNTE